MKKLTRKEKILLCSTVVGVGVAGYLSVKCYQYKKRCDILTEHDDRLKFLEFLVIESECIPKAKQNGNNKLAREEHKINGIIDSIVKYPNDESLRSSLQKHEAEAAAIRYQLTNIDKLEDLMNNDKNIYAK